MADDNKSKVLSLVAYIAGRGFPTEIGEERLVELEIMRIIRSLEEEKQSCKEMHNLLAGNWRLIFTTSEQLNNMSFILGGPLKLYFESIGESDVHIAAPFKGLFMIMTAPVLLFVCLAIAILNQLSFVAAMYVTVTVFLLVARYGPSGLFASRRVDFKVHEDGTITSRLERDVLAVVASQFAFDKQAIDPMPSFCSNFDKSNGSKDFLKTGFYLGWRLVPRPLCLHLKAKETMRKEKVAYVDQNVRIMIGGDIAKDGSISTGVSVYVRI